MPRRLALLLPFALTPLACAPPAGETIQGLYGVPLPGGVRVVHYYGEAAGMDPTFAWALTPVDDAYLKALIQANKLAPSSPANPPPPAEYRFPGWWDYPRLYKLPESYYNDTGTGGLRRIWVDRKSERMYIEFIGT